MIVTDIGKRYSTASEKDVIYTVVVFPHRDRHGFDYKNYKTLRGAVKAARTLTFWDPDFINIVREESGRNWATWETVVKIERSNDDVYTVSEWVHGKASSYKVV